MSPATSTLRQRLFAKKKIAIAAALTVAVLLVVVGVVLQQNRRPTIEIAATGINEGPRSIPAGDTESDHGFSGQVADDATSESHDAGNTGIIQSPDSETTASENQPEPAGWEEFTTPPEGLDAEQAMSEEGTESPTEFDPTAENPETNPDEQPSGEEASPDEADALPQKSRRSKRVAPDLFPVGSRWIGKFRQRAAGQKAPFEGTWDMTVIARGKGTFRIRTVDDKGTFAAEVDGVIHGNRIDWDTSKAKVERGTIGRLRATGQITNGDRLEIHFGGRSIVGEPTSGVGTMHRQP